MAEMYKGLAMIEDRFMQWLEDMKKELSGVKAAVMQIDHDRRGRSPTHAQDQTPKGREWDHLHCVDLPGVANSTGNGSRLQ